MGELEQGLERWIGFTLQELVDRFPRHADVVREAANTDDALSPHVLANDGRDSSDSSSARAVARERPGGTTFQSLLATILSVRHLTMLSFNARDRARTQE